MKKHREILDNYFSIDKEIVYNNLRYVVNDFKTFTKQICKWMNENA